MNKKASSAAPITPGEAPKKDNTLKIVIICVIVLGVLPLLGFIAIGAIIFGMVINIANSNLTNTNPAGSYSVSSPDGEYIFSSGSTALENMYNIASSTSEIEDSYYTVTRSQCKLVEDYLDDELGDGIKVCDDWGFRAFAYSGGKTRVLELYGVGFDSGQYVQIIMNPGFDEYYKITVDDADNGNVGPAKLIRYSDSKKTPIVPQEDIDESEDGNTIEESVDIDSASNRA